jgi:cyclophilin family peptidyl-prolyl cis-trans isomerase
MKQNFALSSWKRATIVLAGLTLFACGGGSSSVSSTDPVVSAVTPEANPAVGKASTFTISGANLPATVTPTVTGCSGVTTIASTSTTSRQFTCVPESLNVGVSISYSTATPFTASISVPRPKVTMVTTLGNVEMELYPEKAPTTVKNFLGYVNSGFYSGTVFHRVAVGFVSQGGGFTLSSSGIPTVKPPTSGNIVLESNNGLSNLKYTLAMARLSSPNTANSQFFFNAADNGAILDYRAAAPTNFGYAVFGKAVAGTAILDTLNAIPTVGENPISPPLIQSITQTQ